jgi:NAD(P)-dependent dehydrogenase (short-subunit alcohol dehydrogenase family)
MSTKNKTIFITGGATGIGLETARQLASEQCNVCVFSKSAPKDPGAKEFFSQDSQHILFVRGDITKAAEAKSAVQKCIKKFGGIDVLINNAALGGKTKLFEKTTPKEWEQLLKVNIQGTLLVTQLVLPFMKKQKSGCIINISSGAGLYGIEGLSIYSLTKAAVLNFTQSLAQEVSGFGIRVITITPGSTDTRMFKTLFPGKKPHHTAAQVAQVIVRAIKKEVEPDSRHVIDVFYHQR